MKTEILGKEADYWYHFCTDHPNMRVTQACLENITLYQFWSVADRYPDLVMHLHVQIRLMGNSILNDSVPWLANTDGKLCLFCKEGAEDVSHFLLD